MMRRYEIKSFADAKEYLAEHDRAAGVVRGEPIDLDVYDSNINTYDDLLDLIDEIRRRVDHPVLLSLHAGAIWLQRKLDNEEIFKVLAKELSDLLEDVESTHVLRREYEAAAAIRKVAPAVVGYVQNNDPSEFNGLIQ